MIYMKIQNKLPYQTPTTMKKEKDIVDFLKEKKQLEQQLSELRSKKNLLPTEEVIIEEIERELRIVTAKIAKY